MSRDLPAALNVFITGASSGIGQALAREYARQGARLGLVGRNGAALQSLVSEFSDPARHQCYVLDVTDHDALAEAARHFMNFAGNVHVVIANAGISQGTLTECSEDLPVFERIIATNLVATAATFAPFIDAMKRHGEPARLVGIASVAGIRGLPGAEAYSASKAAVISYCESLRLELRGTTVRVVTIAPGYIDTPMTRRNRYPMPFLMPVEKFARRACATIASGSSYRVIPWQMGLVAKLLRLLPNAVYDAVFARAPRKGRGHEH